MEASSQDTVPYFSEDIEKKKINLDDDDIDDTNKINTPQGGCSC